MGTNSFQTRHLLQYQTPAPEWDILNQHTFDEWDWFLYIFSFCFAGCMCFWAGWIWHGKHVKNLIVEDKDVLEYSTPISPSKRNNTYPAFPDSAWEQSPPSSNKRRSQTMDYILQPNESKKAIRTHTAPMIIVTDTDGQKHKLDKRELGHLPQLSLHSAVSADEVLTYKTKNATILMMPIETKKKKAPNVQSRTERNNSMPHMKLKNIAIPIKAQENDLKEQSEIEDVPQWNGTVGISETVKGIKSPDDDEESESHLSMDMYMRQSSNPAEHHDVFTPNDPTQKANKYSTSPYKELEELSPVMEEMDKYKDKKNRFKIPFASKMSPIKSGSYDMDDDTFRIGMDSDNKMIYTDYGDDEVDIVYKTSPKMLETLTPPTNALSDNVVEFGFNHSTK